MSMTRFPLLKTGVAAQHPFEKRTRFATRLLRFMDGDEQRLPEMAGAQREWRIQLDGLDEGEWQSHAAAFEKSLAGTEPIVFTDPITNQDYECIFRGPEFEVRTNPTDTARLDLTLIERK